MFIVYICFTFVRLWGIKLKIIGEGSRPPFLRDILDPLQQTIQFL